MGLPCRDAWEDDDDVDGGGGAGGRGLDPTVVVGGRVDALGSNARLGTRSIWWRRRMRAIESFLKLSPMLAVVTNLDREHMDCYRDMEDVESAFVEFMDKVPFYGAVTACVDNRCWEDSAAGEAAGLYVWRERGADFRVEMLPKRRRDCSHSCFEVNCARGWCWGRLSCMFRGGIMC
jgi:UDP-N-acetylmuramate--alanine ligase